MREVAAIGGFVGTAAGLLGGALMSGMAAARDAAEERRVANWIEYEGARADGAEGLAVTYASDLGAARQRLATQDLVIADLEDELSDLTTELAAARAELALLRGVA